MSENKNKDERKDLHPILKTEGLEERFKREDELLDKIMQRFPQAILVLACIILFLGILASFWPTSK